MNKLDPPSAIAKYLMKDYQDLYEVQFAEIMLLEKTEAEIQNRSGDKRKRKITMANQLKEFITKRAAVLIELDEVIMRCHWGQFTESELRRA